MSVKKNFIFNGILLVSQYIIPLIVFPYVSRVFGVERIGLVNFVDSIVNYFILFSTLGLTLTGIRETAKFKNDPQKLTKVFSELVSLHIIATFFVLIAYIVCIFSFDKLRENYLLYMIGASKLLFNVFLIEWFFRGIENFKFITIRSILIKVVYVFLLFALVKEKEDYHIYFFLTCGVTVINALVNCWYAKRHVSFTVRKLNIRRHFNSFLTIGGYLILNSMYTTFNVAYLGFVSGDTSVGNYTTSLKLYTIILGVFSALNIALVPRLNSLISENRSAAFNELIEKSIVFVCTLCFPVIMFGVVLAPEIIFILSGPGFEGAVFCFRIIIPLIFVVGMAQILSNQILMSLKRDKDLVITSAFGAFIGITLNIMLVSRYAEIGTSLVVLISEVSVTFFLMYFCNKHINLKFPLKNILLNLCYSAPYVVICFLARTYIQGSVTIIVFSLVISAVYFYVSQVWLIKNELILVQVDSMKMKIMGSRQMRKNQ